MNPGTGRNPGSGMNPGTEMNLSTEMNPDMEMKPIKVIMGKGVKPYLGKKSAEINPDQLAFYHWYYSGDEKIVGYIESALRSSRTNEVYFFLQTKYMRLYYTSGQQIQLDDKILTDLRSITDGFPSLVGTKFEAYGVKCSFDTEGNKAYIFYNNVCAYFDYVNDKILSYTTIDDMFPVLKNTVFEDGIDSAFRLSRGKEVYLFKNNKYACIAYDSKQLIDTIGNITIGFPVLKGTIFEDGIHACFASHKGNQVYLFKGENYVLMNFIPGTRDHTFMHGVKPIVDGWSSFRGILPIDTSYDIGPSDWSYEIDSSDDDSSDDDFSDDDSSDDDSSDDDFSDDDFSEDDPSDEQDA
ncbi:hypothetical protein VNO80_14220 [Phaseolus coccineus]|uniref:Uncharacterized protein n=1 Tax=Phaseolus coccineus TaxID=3886 RepID=A0AAN9MHI0_PHACN